MQQRKPHIMVAAPRFASRDHLHSPILDRVRQLEAASLQELQYGHLTVAERLWELAAQLREERP